jgi:hypothetical protein
MVPDVRGIMADRKEYCHFKNNSLIILALLKNNLRKPQSPIEHVTILYLLDSGLTQLADVSRKFR